ncbi:MAG: M23 family metallopeptidase [Lachnospiraceae bacterium]|nr:M23 family metallopeptidase [Lachnospiraceae bacterium]
MDETKKKKPLRYTVLIVPNNSGRVKQFRFSLDFFVVVLCIAIIGFMGCVAYLIHHSSTVKLAQAQADAITAQVTESEKSLEQLVSANVALTVQNEDLKAEVDKLNAQLSRTSYVEQQTDSAEAAKLLPTGLPLSGQTTVPPKYDESISGLEFTVGIGSKIVATGNGTVKSIVADNELGYIVSVDHGNDYVSIYCYSAEPVVSEGDAVTRGQTLFVTNADDVDMIYRIKFKDNYIDPNGIIDTAG